MHRRLIVTRAWPRLLLPVILLVFTPVGVHAHDGVPPAPENIWYAWNLDPLIVLALTLTSWLYARGVRALWQKAGRGRAIARWQVAAFAGGIVTLFIALVSPIDRLGVALFSGHMLQHVLLILVAAPLVVMGAPNLAFLWALPVEGRVRLGSWWKGAGALRRAWQVLSHPASVWMLHALALWIWHIPALYEAAIENQFLHALEHASFFGSALLFWWLLTQVGVRRRTGYGLALIIVFTTMMQGTLMGALITLASEPWYPIHTLGAEMWNITPLEDQQLAGLIMWIPGAPVYLLAFLLLMREWLRAAEREVRRWEDEGWPGMTERAKG
jgi:putative membrane protein